MALFSRKVNGAGRNQIVSGLTSRNDGYRRSLEMGMKAADGRGFRGRNFSTFQTRLIWSPFGWREEGHALSFRGFCKPPRKARWHPSGMKRVSWGVFVAEQTADDQAPIPGGSIGPGRHRSGRILSAGGLAIDRRRRSPPGSCATRNKQPALLGVGCRERNHPVALATSSFVKLLGTPS